MESRKPDYKKYTLEELEDVLSNIDKERFPERYNEIVELLNNPKHRKRLERQQKKINTERREYQVAGHFVFVIAWGLMGSIFGITYTKYRGIIEVDSIVTRFFFGVFTLLFIFFGYKRFIK